MYFSLMLSLTILGIYIYNCYDFETECDDIKCYVDCFLRCEIHGIDGSADLCVVQYNENTRNKEECLFMSQKNTPISDDKADVLLISKKKFDISRLRLLFLNQLPFTNEI